jgi:hypothetical protein
MTITPDDLARKLLRALLAELGEEEDHDDQVKVGSNEYNLKVMESDYDEDWQISGKEGQILVFDLVTYGYGEDITWEELEKYKAELTEWATPLASKYHFTFQFSVSANYW